MILTERDYERFDHQREMLKELELREQFEAKPNPRIQLHVGDITLLKVGAIVNASNSTLLGGGGVDGAIHRAAGPMLVQDCLTIPEVKPGVRCPTGEARITAGFGLPSWWVIHTVGPVWRDHGSEPELLAMCYRSSLKLAAQQGIRSLAFPAISTGVYGFPKPLAAQIAVREVRAFLTKNQFPERVVFVAFSAEDLTHYEAALRGAK